MIEEKISIQSERPNSDAQNTTLLDAIRPEYVKRMLNLENVDSAPSRLVKVSPQYPPKLLRNKVNVRVDVLIVIVKEGDVANYQIMQSTHTEFSNAVTRVISQWKFSSAIKDGKRVSVSKIQPFLFGKQ